MEAGTMPRDEAAVPDEEAPEGEETAEETQAEAAGDGEDGALFDVNEFSLDPGGENPEKSLLVLSSGKKEIANELKRGQEVALLVHARVEEVKFKGDTRTQVLAVLDIFEHGDIENDDPQLALMGDGSDPHPPAPEDEAEPEATAGETVTEAVEEAAAESGVEAEVVDAQVVEEEPPATPQAAADSDLDWD